MHSIGKATFVIKILQCACDFLWYILDHNGGNGFFAGEDLGVGVAYTTVAYIAQDGITNIGGMHHTNTGISQAGSRTGSRTVSISNSKHSSLADTWSTLLPQLSSTTNTTGLPMTRTGGRSTKVAILTRESVLSTRNPARDSCATSVKRTVSKRKRTGSKAASNAGTSAVSSSGVGVTGHSTMHPSCSGGEGHGLSGGRFTLNLS